MAVSQYDAVTLRAGKMSLAFPSILSCWLWNFPAPSRCRTPLDQRQSDWRRNVGRLPNAYDIRRTGFDAG